MHPKKWEVWYANVIFEEDKNQSKCRPTIVLVAGTDFIVGLKVTTKGPRQNDYTLEHWKEAGLPEKSFVRIDKKVKIPDGDIIRKIGEIHPVDRLLIEYRLAALV